MSYLVISHRGNLDGPNPKEENHPEYITFAIKSGYHAEIDVRYLNGKFYLGHDNPNYEVHKSFFTSKENWSKLWVHCKNIDALYHLADECNCFYHDKDDCVLTSGGYIWTYPNKSNILTSISVAVLPELIPDWDLSNCHGVCTDYALKYSNRGT